LEQEGLVHNPIKPDRMKHVSIDRNLVGSYIRYCTPTKL